MYNNIVHYAQDLYRSVIHRIGRHAVMLVRDIDPSAVKLEEMECCALRCAIESGFHKEFIKENIEAAQKVEPKYVWSILTEIFENTLRLVFIPRDIHKRFYFNLALKEGERINSVDVNLSCNHTTKEHLAALDNVCLMMAFKKDKPYLVN